MKKISEIECGSKSIRAKIDENGNSVVNGTILVKGIGQTFDSISEIVNGQTIVPVIIKNKFNFKIKKYLCLGRGMEVSEECLTLSEVNVIEGEKVEANTIEKEKSPLFELY